MAKNEVEKVNIKNETQFKNLAVDNKMINYLILFILGLIPLITHLKPLQLISPNLDPLTYLTTGNVVDFFTYYKFYLLLITSGLALLLFIFHLYTKKINAKINTMNIYLIVFLIFLAVSSLLSDFKTTALWGSYQRHVGFITYSSLILLMVVIINTKFKTNLFNSLIYALYPVTIVNTVLVVLHFLNFNVLNNSFIKFTILGQYSETELKTSSFIIGTVGHFNYTSALGAILFAIFCGKALFAAKIKSERVTNFIMSILGVTIIFGSGSLNGLVTLLFILIFITGIIIDRKSLHEIYSLAGLVGFLILEFSLFSLYDPTLFKDFISNSSIIALTAIIAVFVLFAFLLFKHKPLITIKRITVSLSIILVLAIGLSLSIGDKIVNKINMEIMKMDSQTIDQNLTEDEFNLPPTSWTMGTGRLYIWKETLELISEKPFLGYGLDTLAFTLDQNDPAKISSMNEPDLIIDKPHNSYLYVLYGAGILTFIALMIIIVQVLRKGFKMIASEAKDYELQWPLLLGIMAYLYQGLFNDPVIGIQIIFWIIMGYSYLLSVKE